MVNKYAPVIVLSFVPSGLFEATVKMLVQGGYTDIHAVTSSMPHKRFKSRRLKSLTILPPDITDDKIILDDLLSLSQRVKSEALLPVRTQDVMFVADHHKELVKMHPVLVPNSPLLHQVSNKLHFTNLVKSLGLSVPKTIVLSHNLNAENVISKLGFPIISKPTIGKAGIGITLIQNSKELRALIHKSSTGKNIILQQYMAGEDVAMTMLANSGNVFAVVLRKRWYTRPNTRNFSPMRDMEFFQDSWLEELGRKFVVATNFSGIADFDLKVDFSHRKAWFLECDPRIMGTMNGMGLFGINIPKLLVDQVRGLLPEKTCVRPEPGHFLTIGSLPSWISIGAFTESRHGTIRTNWKNYLQDPFATYYKLRKKTDT